MRSKILIIILLALLSVDCSAQKPIFGMSMGANFSNLIGRDRIEDSKPRIGVCPGINVDIPLVYDTYLEIGCLVQVRVPFLMAMGRSTSDS